MRVPPFLLALALVLTACEGEGPRPADDVELDEREAHTVIEAPEESPEPAEMVDGVQRIELLLTETGFEPVSILFEPGGTAEIGITRRGAESCDEMVQIPAFGLSVQPASIGERVVLEFEPRETGVFQIVCGIDTERGRIVVG